METCRIPCQRFHRDFFESVAKSWGELSDHRIMDVFFALWC